jgi:hypothetical protein
MTAPRPFATLRRFLPSKQVERCELCGAALAPGHPHLVEIASRRVRCACQACGILFDRRSDRYRRLGSAVRFLPEFQMSDAEWEALTIPIGLAFFLYSTSAARTLAFYPGPAGCTESLLPLHSWDGIADRNPELQRMEPDIEALLVNRIGARREHFVVPVDRCYQLVGLIRLHWHGLSGGEGVWDAIDSFFAQLKEAGHA